MPSIEQVLGACDSLPLGALSVRAEGASGGRMAPVQFLMDAGLFSVEVRARTAHRYTDQLFLNLACSDIGCSVPLVPKHEDVETIDVEGGFRSSTLDERLRRREPARDRRSPHHVGANGSRSGDAQRLEAMTFAPCPTFQGRPGCRLLPRRGPASPRLRASLNGLLDS